MPKPDFYPRSPCGERLKLLSKRLCNSLISIHALLAESDLWDLMGGSNCEHFYPRSPCGERQNANLTNQSGHYISIHALLAESDSIISIVLSMPQIFLSTLSLRRATFSALHDIFKLLAFLSTLSLRRATKLQRVLGRKSIYFYPRSPCGERRMCHTVDRVRAYISIHALLAESDRSSLKRTIAGIKFLSTLSLRRATPLGYAGDCATAFLSTLSLRRATRVPLAESTSESISIHALLAESDLEQSSSYSAYLEISIHALLAESDNNINSSVNTADKISIHALLAESDGKCR